MDINYIKKHQLVILECIAGSQAYGLAGPNSDTDIRGVFVLPKANYYGLEYIPQIHDERNDVVYYEVKRFMDLISKSNPNILELLNIPSECIIYQDPLFAQIKSLPVLSKRCKDTFAGYAYAQIKKARGLNKKILNPMDKKRKSILDFCYVSQDQGSLPLLQWLDLHHYKSEQCGLINIPHLKNTYALFYDVQNILGYKGIIQKEKANEVALSSVPKSEKVKAYLFFNQEGYSVYCKNYKNYWDWVEQRNPVRYEKTIAAAKNYDTKNMMHTFRLLAMAEEIATENIIKVRRPDRDFLLSIRNGVYAYEHLLEMAENKMAALEDLYEKSALALEPDIALLESTLVNIRSDFYRREGL
ncbi:MAG: nucleotidyltransferase domain-containing protein [Bacteroidota bacterium]